LQRVNKDRHLGIRFETPRPADATKPAGKQRKRPELKDVNYGFARVEVIEGNVGYLDLQGFIGVEGGIARADAAMAFLTDVRALIIDLGHNTGGDETMVKHLSTYLFDVPTHLVNTFARGMEKPKERWTLKEVPSKRLSKIPVYVLVSRKTISAAESFTFGLAANKRVTVVGERTGGGGHFGGVQPLAHGFSIWLPRGRTFDPKTGEGWEATGIKPDVEVPYDKALAAALDHAKRQLGN
jgi:C-terminal processing protease CtpA/Prc